QQRESLRRKLLVTGLSEDQFGRLEGRKELTPAVPVRAPIDGTVVTFDRAVGQAVKPDEKLFGIHDLSQPLVQGYASERDAAAVRPGQPVRVRLAADPGFLAEGTVVRTGRVFGSDNRTLSLWVELSRPADRVLLHGQLARLALTLDRPPAVPALPLTAVVAEATRNYVFVRNDDGTFDRPPVQL